MTYDYKKIAKMLTKKYGINHIDVAMVLGSGLGNACPDVENRLEVPYCSLGMSGSKVIGHSGKFIFGDYAGKKIVIMSRFHFYESGRIEDVKLPYQIVAELGAKMVVLTTASGSMNKDIAVGDLVIIKDHINLVGTNPLMVNKDVVFVDTSNTYDKDLRAKVLQIAKTNKITVKQGVHIQTLGRYYETPAEVRMMMTYGGDTVSMSTCLDALTCLELGIKVIGFASISNMASGLSEEFLTHENVLKVCSENAKKLKVILSELLK